MHPILIENRDLRNDNLFLPLELLPLLRLRLRRCSPQRIRST